MFPLQAATSVSARAFYDDPLFSWLFPMAASRLTLLSGTMKAIVAMRVPLGSVVLDDTVCPRAVLAYETPAKRVGLFTELRYLLPTLLRFLPTLLRYGTVWEQLRRVVAGFRALAATGTRRPHAPHFYIAVLTVDPPHQRTGLGRRVLSQLLLECDREKAATHLETARAENVGYYERFGFRVVEKMTLGDCPPIWIMTRPAVTS